MENMNNLIIALHFLREYIDSMKIDVFALPVLTGHGIDIAIIDAEMFFDDVKDYVTDCGIPPYLTMRKGEQYFRISTIMSANKICLPPHKKIKTQYKKFGEWPRHHGSIARGFELVVTSTLNGIHLGDNISSIDCVTDFGNTEVKTPKALVIKQTGQFVE